MSLLARFIFKLEKWLPISLSFILAALWHFFCHFATDLIKVTPSNLYPTLITIASIVLSLLSLIKTLLLASPNTKGMDLLKTNLLMWQRFIKYITRSMVAQGVLIMIALLLLIIDRRIGNDYLSYVFITIFTYAIASFVRVQMVFSYMLKFR